MNWQVCTLGDLCKIDIGKTPSRDNNRYWGPGHPFLSISDMSQGKYLSITKESITDAAVRESNCKLVPPNTLLLSFKLSIGKVGFSQVPIYTNEAIAALYIREEESIDKHYLYWALKTVDLMRYVDKAAKGATLNKAKLNLIEIPLPPLDEQKRIATILDKADTLCAKGRQAIALLDDLLKSTFTSMFNSSTIRTMTVEEATSVIIDYRGKTPVKTTVGVPLITAKVIKDGYIDEPTEFISEDYYDMWMRRGLPEIGDVLFTTEAPMGKVAQLRESKVALAQRVLLLRGKKKLVNNTYLMHSLMSPFVKQQLDKITVGTTVTGIRQRDFRTIEIPVPPIDEQIKFNQLAEKIQEQHNKYESFLKRSEDLFATIQQTAFTGELFTKSVEV